MELKYEWEDCSIGFHCPLCNIILIADSQNEQLTCDCGKFRYQLSALVMFEFTDDDK